MNHIISSNIQPCHFTILKCYFQLKRHLTICKASFKKYIGMKGYN
nr:MAG TPA: hypothetical protein [Caudoviricetes sp.]